MTKAQIKANIKELAATYVANGGTNQRIKKENFSTTEDYQTYETACKKLAVALRIHNQPTMEMWKQLNSLFEQVVETVPVPTNKDILAEYA